MQDDAQHTLGKFLLISLVFLLGLLSLTFLPDSGAGFDGYAKWAARNMGLAALLVWLYRGSLYALGLLSMCTAFAALYLFFMSEDAPLMLTMGFLMAAVTLSLRMPIVRAYVAAIGDLRAEVRNVNEASQEAEQNHRDQ